MASRSEKSEERQKKDEPRDLVLLMQRMEREILMLFGEMGEILRYASVRYDLFPRITAVLTLYWHAKQAALPNVFFRPRGGNAHLVSPDRWPMQRALLQELDRSGRKDELGSETWKVGFRKLRQGVESEIEESRQFLFPLLDNTYSPRELEDFGTLFRQSMKWFPDVSAPKQSGQPEIGSAL
jgi:hypothetical protein